MYWNENEISAIFIIYIYIFSFPQVLPVSIAEDKGDEKDKQDKGVISSQSLVNKAKDSIKELLGRPVASIRQYSVRAVVINSLLNEISDEEENFESEELDKEISAGPISTEDVEFEKEKQLTFIQEVRIRIDCYFSLSLSLSLSLFLW